MAGNRVRSISGVRRRVYAFGFVCMLMALGQIAVYMIMLSFSISASYHDPQVAVGSGTMAVLTASYLALTGRLLFLFYERRYEEARGPEWLWWFASLAVILFNIVLVIWFAFLSDVLPGIICASAAFMYLLFFKIATTDIKHIRENDCKAKKKRVKGTEERNGDSAIPHVSTEEEPLQA